MWLVVRVGQPEVGVLDHGLVADESLFDVVTGLGDVARVSATYGSSSLGGVAWPMSRDRI